MLKIYDVAHEFKIDDGEWVRCAGLRASMEMTFPCVRRLHMGRHAGLHAWDAHILPHIM